MRNHGGQCQQIELGETGEEMRTIGKNIYAKVRRLNRPYRMVKSVTSKLSRIEAEQNASRKKTVCQCWLVT